MCIRADAGCFRKAEGWCTDKAAGIAPRGSRALRWPTYWSHCPTCSCSADRLDEALVAMQQNYSHQNEFGKHGRTEEPHAGHWQPAPGHAPGEGCLLASYK